MCRQNQKVLTEPVPYHEDDNDANVFGIFPELVSRDDFGVVDESESEDQQAEQLHQHGALETQQNSVRLVSGSGLTGPSEAV